MESNMTGGIYGWYGSAKRPVDRARENQVDRAQEPQGLYATQEEVKSWPQFASRKPGDR